MWGVRCVCVGPKQGVLNLQYVHNYTQMMAGRAGAARGPRNPGDVSYETTVQHPATALRNIKVAWVDSQVRYLGYSIRILY